MIFEVSKLGQTPLSVSPKTNNKFLIFCGLYLFRITTPPLQYYELQNFYPAVWTTYHGGLTTPPCSEVVQFVIVDEPLVVTKRQLKKLRRMPLGEICVFMCCSINDICSVEMKLNTDRLILMKLFQQYLAEVWTTEMFVFSK